MNERVMQKAKRGVFSLTGAVLVAMIGLIIIDVPVNGIARVAPDPGDDTTNGRYWYVVSQTPYVRINSMEAKAFFNSRNGHSVTIEHADICPNGSDENAGAQGSGNHTRFDIYRIQSDGTSRGAQIGTVYGRKDMSGGCGSRTFSIPNNDLPAINTFEGGPHYGVVIRATHVGAWNTQNGFKIRVDSGVVGMGATSNSRDSGLQSGGADTYERVDIPLRTPCSVTSGSIWRAISVYDPDNGVAGIQPSKFRVRVMHNGNPLPASRYNPGARWTGNAQDGYMPGSNSNEEYSLGVNWRAGERYTIQLRNVYGNNTLQIGIPFDSAPFSLNCDNQPTGRIIDVECTNNGSQRIRFTSQDPDGATQSRIRIGPNASPNYNSGWGADGTRTITVPSGTGGMNFSAGTWVVRLDVRDKRANGSYATDPVLNVDTMSTERCEPPATFGQRVVVRPIVDPPFDPHIEPTETTNFVGRVNISNFPQLNDREWGYSEIASRAMPQEVGPTRYNYTYPSNDSWAGRATANKSGCAQRNRSGTCVSWYWYCEGRYMGTGSTAPTCPAKWRHDCQTYSFTNYNRTGTCTDKSRYVCPSPNGRTYIRVTGNEPDCNVYRCQYAGAPNYITTDPQRSQCERRCNNGTGPRPLRYNQGDYNCYQQPRFTLRCTWDDGDRIDVTVTNNGDYCVRTKQKQGVTISVAICAEYRARNIGGWSPNPPSPGYGSTDGGATFRQITLWGWDIRDPDEKCVRVVGKPTVKVNGGDVAVGGALTSGGICGASPSSSIVGWPHAPVYDASGTEFGAFASRDIFGFSTARINSNLAMAPRSLAFANSPMSGGDRYGGSFGPMPCIADHYGAMPAGLPNMGLGALGGGAGLDGAYQTNSGTINNNPVIQNGQQVTIYVNGNLYIGANGISYNRTGWVTTADIPALKIVAYGGNIYIDPSVSNLDGIYVAQPNGGVGGHIYTCATQTGPIANTSLYNSCRTTLTVNGAFVARQVHLGRTGGGSGVEGGTAIRGETSEEFNYLPELWLGNWPQDNTSSSTKYDAFISLPPVL